MSCPFDFAWTGSCNWERAGSSPMCEEHRNLKCSVCGKQAYKECSYVSDRLCGSLLCKTCKHEHIRVSKQNNCSIIGSKT